jgi:hypothetical protein
LPRCAAQIFDRCAQADARGAAQVPDGGIQAVSRSVFRFPSQVNNRGAKAAARDAAAAEEEQLEIRTVEQIKYHRLYLH